MKKLIVTLAFVLFTTLTWVGCDPTADHALSVTERDADMVWLASIFRNNYAPMEWKKKLTGKDFEALVTKYRREAKRLKIGSVEDNAAFYRLMFRFVAEFQDAHTAGSIKLRQAPGTAKIAYLGFSGVRDGDAFRVTKILPTIKPEEFPVKVGDKITEIDGVPVMEYVKKELVPYRNLGNDLANKTMHMQSLFNRMNLSMPLPAKENVKLTVVGSSVSTDSTDSKESKEPKDPKAPASAKDTKTRKVELPWITKDLNDFNMEQAVFDAMKNKSESIKVRDPGTGKELELALLDHRGKEIPIQRLIDLYTKNQVDFMHSFVLKEPVSFELREATATPDPKAPKTPRDILSKERNIPKDAIMMENSTNFPAYMYTVEGKSETGRSIKKLTGYIRIESFEADDEAAAVKEIRETLRKFKKAGVNNVIVDTIDNPGGSLELMGNISQAFSGKKVRLLDMQFGLNDNWLSQLQDLSLKGSDHEREHYRRIYEKLRAEKNEGKRLSSLYNMEDIFPYVLEPNEGVSFDKVVVLTNEMNASCGDMFPAVMQDNGLAITAGKDTMGAGGNVVDHMNDQAPNSHFKVRQTESLAVRADGSYVENVGVKANWEFDVNKDLKNKYDASRVEAEKIFKDKRTMAQIRKEGPKATAKTAAAIACSDDYEALAGALKTVEMK